MITYKYKLYKTNKTKHLDAMLREACFVWNHALTLYKRYYKMYHSYANVRDVKKHFPKWYNFNYLNSQSVQDILERLDLNYRRFFNHISRRPPKYKSEKRFSSVVFKQCGYSLYGNVFKINKINKNYKFTLTRYYDGNIKNIIVKRNKLGEFFICIVLDKEVEKNGKTHNGASVGIDFGLKTYLTLSDGTKIKNPLFMKESLSELRRRCRNFYKCKKGSNNRERKRKDLDRIWNDICNKRSDFQWKLAHELCRKYDQIFIEDVNLSSMRLSRKANRKLKDQSHSEFVSKLEYVAKKYNVIVHKIDRYYPSSKICTCGYINNELSLNDRMWTCPNCGTIHNRDLLAANNILRQGIVELESDGKTSKHTAKRLSCNHPTIARVST